ncbi:MAG TPA: hypothetical protein VFR55_12195 [Dehalococcoidia bacterium]|nr:hypothetical protein [Dehalococcoidia bacterium]
MAVNQVSDLCLFSVREAAKGFLISLRASNRYSQSYLTALEISVAFLTENAENHGWPPVDQITTSHI